jgi:hypothetical protein
MHAHMPAIRMMINYEECNQWRCYDGCGERQHEETHGRRQEL